MTDAADDPLSHALQALTRALSADPPPAVAEAIREAADALLVAMEEHKAFVAVANTAMALVEALDEYEEAVEGDDEEKIAAASEAGAEAEDALVDALNELHTLVSTDADLSGDVAYLAALDGFADDQDGPAEDQNEDAPAGPPNLRMRFGAEMSDTPAPRLASLTPHEEQVLRMRFGIGMNMGRKPEEKP
jgi:ABC-type transporter Mla subunit MlaD